jgi:uncharacterized CHY-type Zn-finger protein
MRLDPKEVTIAADRYERKPAGSLFPKNADKMRDGVCTVCNLAVGEFKNEISVKEYYISGMCQWCQDRVFR